MAGRYLVTGGAGLVGATVVRRMLARGDEVTVLDSGVAAGFESIEGTGARLIEADIRDPSAYESALGGVDAVVHLAANPSVPGSIERPADDFSINVTGSLGLLEAARAAGVPRFVFASSSSVVAGHEPPTHERLVPRPVSPYGAGKAAIEAYLRAYHSAYGIATVALRFSNAYGPWSAHKSSAVASFMRAYLAGGPIVIRGSGEQTRDFVHVDDVATAVVAAVDRAPDVSGEVFQVGTGTETSLLDLVVMIRDAGGADVPVVHERPSAGDVPRNVSDIAKARQLLDYAPQVVLPQGLASTLEWFRGRQRA